MKQINKFIFGVFLVLGLFLASTYLAKASIQSITPPADDTGTGSTTGTSCKGTDCFGATITSFGQKQITNTRTGSMILTINMSKQVYNKGEDVIVYVSTEYPACGNSTVNVIADGQISTIPNFTTIINENVTGGYGIYGAGVFPPPWKAPSDAGAYNMDVKLYLKINGHYYQSLDSVQLYGIYTDTPVVVAETILPFTITAPCNPPSGYTKCADENGTCSFLEDANVSYGCSPSLEFKQATTSISCDNTTFGGDPLPNIAKSCFYQSIPTVSLTVDGSKNPVPVNPGKQVDVKWIGSSNITSCQGREVITGVLDPITKLPYTVIGGSSFYEKFSVPIDGPTTFIVTCTDENGAVVSSSPTTYYFKLQHCTSSNVFQIGPLPIGKYQTGNVVAGALNDGTYDYVVIDSSANPFPSIPFISGVTNTGGNVCRKL